MINPDELVKGGPNHQLSTKLKDFKKHFQQLAINCVLVMPYSDAHKLTIDLKEASDQLRAVKSAVSIGIICLLTFPLDRSGKPEMTISFVMVSNDPALMTAENSSEWIKHINFGKSK